jgi:RNA methyltransferase, RsmE family
MPRFFSEESLAHLSIDTEWRLSEAVFHHAVRVCRLRVQDPITLFDGSGARWQATITHIDKRGATVKVDEYIEAAASNSFLLTLALPMIAAERMDWALQKGTELGVHVFQPVYGVRSTRLTSEREEKRQAHWRKVLIAACEQCGRDTLPELKAPITMAEALASFDTNALRVLLEASAESGLSTLLAQRSDEAHKTAVLLVGPEGGLTREEVESAQRHHWQTAHLGPRILRAETAAVAAVTLAQAALGDLGEI